MPNTERMKPKKLTSSRWKSNWEEKIQVNEKSKSRTKEFRTKFNNSDPGMCGGRGHWGRTE